MTHTEKYNQYVQEWIKENPAFSGSYEPMLDFDQWIDNYVIEFAEWCLKNGLFTQFKITQRANKELLEIFKKEL
jgi:hypothetical protein